jgi:NADPH:quinone reductase-like Zn-dependent oxidoreductase
MRAWAIGAYGERLRVMELPVPQPKARDVLIRMRGAEVGDWDELVRTGEWPMARPFPLVLGLAGAGVVAERGTQAREFSVGETVYAYSYPLYDNGAWAEYMLVPKSYAALAPRSLPLEHAGSLPIVGLTAHETLTDRLEVKAGEVVLITAAAGGVGHLAVQIAAQLGAHVVATARRRNHAFLRALGAETVIDYTVEDVVKAVHAKYPAGCDKALNGVTGKSAYQAVRCLRKGGRMVDLPGTLSEMPPGAPADVRVDTGYVVRADGLRLAHIAALVDQSRLKLHVEDTLPFEQAPLALQRVLAKTVRGKLALAIASITTEKERSDGRAETIR